MLRIAFINDHLGQGGVGTVNRKLMRGMIEKGVKVHNVTVFEDHSVEGAENHHLKISKVQAFLTFPLVFRLLKVFRNNQFDYVVSSKDYINIWTIIAFRMSGSVKGRLLVNSHVSVTAKLKNERKLIQRLSILAARFIYRGADFVANVSESASRDSERYFRLDKVHTLYNPVIDRADIEAIHQQPDHPFFHRRGRVIVACGRLEAQKNYDLMIRAFAKALSADPDIYLIILGEGSMRKSLEELIDDLHLQNRVSLLGFHSSPKSYMAHCNLFWLTSRYEGFGVVLVEALSVGARVLSTDCPHGPREILSGGTFGMLIDSMDVGRNSEALLVSLNSPLGDADILKKRALDFEVSACVEQYLKIFRGEGYSGGGK